MKQFWIVIQVLKKTGHNTWLLQNATFYCYAECHNAGCHNAGCHNAGCHNAGCHNAGCHNAKCFYSEFNNAECHLVSVTILGTNINIQK